MMFSRASTRMLDEQREAGGPDKFTRRTTDISGVIQEDERKRTVVEVSRVDKLRQN